MDKNEVQRTAKQRSNRKSGKKALKVQLNVRIASDLLRKLQKVSKNSGRSITWIVDHAIRQTLEFNG